MNNEVCIDYSHVPERHAAIHARLENWARYVSVRRIAWPMQPMFRNARARRWALFTKAVRRELEPVWAADTRRKLLAMGLVPRALVESVSTALQGAAQ